MTNMSTKEIIRGVSLLLCMSLAVQLVDGAAFNVKKYGVKANGKSDDSQGFQNAWKEACSSASPSTLVIPKGTYLVQTVTFQGPCKAPIRVQLQGSIIAPTVLHMPTKQDGWVSFRNINALTLSGGGSFDGQGHVAWKQNDCAKTGKCNSLPINLRITSVTNSLIQDISSLNSKLFHMNILNCKNLTLNHITINAPETSLNTDGIHIGRSTNINITNANIKTGDDCVSLGDGCQQIHVEKVTCGPGHGISVGSLGRYDKEEPVIGVTVKNCTLSNTMNGVRVKTWPASPNGVASDLHFEDIVMNNVGTPILVDQEYCPYGQCQAKVPSRVKISNVSFKKIRGTSSTQVAVKLVCSKGLPCQHVDLSDINLVYKGKEGQALSECANVSPRLGGQMFPKACTKAHTPLG